MGMTDPISDMLTRIRNAQMVHKGSVDIPASRIKEAIARILVDEGYVARVEGVADEEGRPQLRLSLKYYQNRPVIETITRVSKPGRRIYVAKDEIPPVRQGLGITILSTNRGVLSGRQARKLGVGGEVLCTVF